MESQTFPLAGVNEFCFVLLHSGASVICSSFHAAFLLDG